MASWWIVRTPEGTRQTYAETRPDATATQIDDPIPGVPFLRPTPPAFGFADEGAALGGAGVDSLGGFQMPTDPAAYAPAPPPGTNDGGTTLPTDPNAYAPSPPPVGGGSVLPPGYTPPANFTPEQVDEVLRGLGAENLAPGGPGAITFGGPANGFGGGIEGFDEGQTISGAGSIVGPGSGYTGSHNPGGQYTIYGQGAGGSMPRQQMLDELGNFGGQFFNKFNIPAYGASPFQQWQTRQFGPTLAAHKLGSQANPNRTFEDFLGTPDVLMGARGQLSQGYEDLLGSADQGAASQTREAIGADAWEELLNAQLRAKRGQFYGPSLARRLPAMEQQYEATPEGFEAPDTYGFMRNILRARFGI